jgi:hypothetical protein
MGRGNINPGGVVSLFMVTTSLPALLRSVSEMTTRCERLGPQVSITMQRVSIAQARCGKLFLVKLVKF